MSKTQPDLEVLGSNDARRLAGLAAAALMLGGLGALGCLGCLGCLSSQNETSTSDIMLTAAETAQGDSTAMESSTQPAIMTTTDAPETTMPDPGSSSGGATTMEIPAGCGDGVVDGSEECDEGEANANDGACTQACKHAACGDGYVQAAVGEVCDDGVNDGKYGGCLPNCSYANSCKQIRDAFADDVTVVDGVYSIERGGTPALPVYCEMDADGGGYTYLKVAVPKDKPKLSATDAEAQCGKYSMRLLVPRTQAHLAASVMAAKSALLKPVGGGTVMGDLEYLSILGVYPVTVNKSCVGKPFNSEACPEWKANDNGVYWVSDTPVDGEPGIKNCAGCSMSYYWTAAGMLDYYQMAYNGGDGGQSLLFMCDVGDK